VLLLDVGANVTCRPEHLIQFAHMGAAFAQAVIGISEPRVALLSNGEEPAKGTPDLISVHEQLAGPAGAGLRFVGNIEGTRLFERAADVVVMDGFTGNIALKLAEGVSERTLRAVREAAAGTWRGRLGAALIERSIRALRDEIDPEHQGGAYMLGLRQLGVVAHGRFSRLGFARAIEVAARGVREDVIGRMRAALTQAGALRPPRGELVGAGGGEPRAAAGDGGAPSEPPATVSNR
jgi:glycerol-3-phosphate acyltransferase PlsX